MSELQGALTRDQLGEPGSSPGISGSDSLEIKQALHISDKLQPELFTAADSSSESDERQLHLIAHV